MADAKISALTAGTVLATGDLFVVVDVSDPTMAASGTDKKYTVATIGADPVFLAALAAGLGTTTNGTYTPTLVGMVIGTGGTPIDTASFTFTGLPAGGTLTVEGKIKFGTAGTTFPAALSTIGLPTGYSLIDTDPLNDLSSSVTYNDVSASQPYKGQVRPNTTTTVRLVITNVSGTLIQLGPTSTILPFTWAINDEIYYKFTVRATGP